MTGHTKPPPYRIYLLTIWLEQGRDYEASQMWRFSLKEPRTGKQRGFAGLTELIIALHAELNVINQEASSDLE